MTFDGNQSKPNLGRPQHPVPLRAHPRRGRTSPKPAPTSASSRIFPSANSPKHSSVNRPITASPTAAFGHGSSAATASPAAAARPRMNYPPSSAQCATPLHGPPRDPKSSFAATRRLSSFGQIVMSRSAIVILACGAQPQAVARPRSCASAPSMPRSTVAKLSASPPRSSLRSMDVLLPKRRPPLRPGHRRPHHRSHSRGRRSLPQRPLQESDQSSLLWPRQQRTPRCCARTTCRHRRTRRLL